MSSRINLRVSTVIFLILLPSLILISLSTGKLVYSNLNKRILDGFDRKLYSVSTAVASFIDGNNHKDLLKIKQTRGMAYNQKLGLIYANYALEDYVIKIRQRGGNIRTVGPHGVQFSGDLAYDDQAGVLYTVDEVSGELVSINPRDGDGQGVVIGETGYECYGLAYDSDHRVLYSNNENLIKIDPKTGVGEVIGYLGDEFSAVRGLAFDNKNRRLYGIDTHSNQLLKINIHTGAGKLIGNLRQKDEITGQENRPLKFGVFGLAYDENKKKLYGSGTLDWIEIDPETALTKPMAVQIIPEKEKILYKRYADPMIRIMEKRDLTYLYTCVLRDRARRLSYVLDATQNEFHGWVGWTDPDEPDENTKNSWFQGKVFISDIQPWEEWGLLKSAYIPIFDDNDDVVAIAGADVDISIIKEKRGKALLKVFLIGTGLLAVGIFVSMRITQQIVKPLRELKEMALSVAGGKYGHKVNINTPFEMEILSGTFNEMSEALEMIITELSESNLQLEHRRRDQELRRLMARRIDSKKYPDSNRIAHGYAFAPSYSYHAIGWVIREDEFILWNGKSPEESMESVKLKDDMANIIEWLADRYSNWDEFNAELKKIFPDNLYYLCRFYPEKNMIKTFSRKPTKAIVINKLGETEIIDLQERETFLLEENHAVIIASLPYDDLLTLMLEIKKKAENPDSGFSVTCADGYFSILKDLLGKTSIFQKDLNSGIFCAMTASDPITGDRGVPLER